MPACPPGWGHGSAGQARPGPSRVGSGMVRIANRLRSQGMCPRTYSRPSQRTGIIEHTHCAALDAALCAGAGSGLQARQASYEDASPALHSPVTQVCQLRHPDVIPNEWFSLDAWEPSLSANSLGSGSSASCRQGQVGWHVQWH